MKKLLQNILSITLAATMTMSLAACSQDNGGGSNVNNNSGGNGGSQSSSNVSDNSGGAKADKIVLWTLSNDLKQFAERYTNETGNEVAGFCGSL